MRIFMSYEYAYSCMCMLIPEHLHILDVEIKSNQTVHESRGQKVAPSISPGMWQTEGNDDIHFESNILFHKSISMITRHPI